jgi:glycosyltransferase involved in cell wall biosynthesis
VQVGSQSRLSIAIAAQGRFHAFALASAFIKQGHDVCLLTNYPATVVEHFGVPRQNVRSFILHGLITRLASALQLARICEPMFHRMFGRWVANELSQRYWDVTYTFSGVSEEWLKLSRKAETIRLLARGSSHIRTQKAILSSEQRRCGHVIDQPSEWRIDRECREYSLADGVVVLSQFAQHSFLDNGFPLEQVSIARPGVDIAMFRAAPHVVTERRRRILGNEPLKVLTVGLVSYRKGLSDYAEVVPMCDANCFRFRWVGTVLPEAREQVARLSSTVDFQTRVPQSELARHYAWADLFFFPSLEDGFGVVLAQAAAAALPILTTPNGAGQDLVEEGRTGWILPIRDSSAFVSKLNQCCEDRQRLADMVMYLSDTYVPRDFGAMARDFLQIVAKRKELNAARI